MSDLLDKAVARAKDLSADQQDALAALILEEIKDEKRWDEALASSPDVLERLAAEAEVEDRRGLAEELDPNIL